MDKNAVDATTESVHLYDREDLLFLLLHRERRELEERLHDRFEEFRQFRELEREFEDRFDRLRVSFWLFCPSRLTCLGVLFAATIRVVGAGGGGGVGGARGARQTFAVLLRDCLAIHAFAGFLPTSSYLDWPHGCGCRGSLLVCLSLKFQGGLSEGS